MPSHPDTTFTSGFLAETHEVTNVACELQDYNMYTEDAALVEAVQREGGAAAQRGLVAFGHMAGAADYLELGRLVNHVQPEFDSHDRFGRRIDLVKFHPAYHQLMKTAMDHGLHASPWTAPEPGAHVARAARFYLQSQVEAGHGCPVTMTFAAVPTLRLQPDLADAWLPRITSSLYGALPPMTNAAAIIQRATPRV